MERLELLAKIQHEIWSHWMKYMFDICEKGKDGTLIIPADKVKRWTRQLQTEYDKLSTSEQQTDQYVVIEHNIENRLQETKIIKTDIGE